MKIRSELFHQSAGFAASLFARCLMSTLEYRVAYYDCRVDPVRPEYDGPAVYLLWHEYILFPLYLRGHTNTAVLLSRHQDAEVLSRAAGLMGFQTIRGSTNRGGVAALRQSLRKSRHMNLAMTPDGPRGPRRRLAPGCVYLSSRLGIPLVAIGLRYDRPWRIPGAWDHFALPRPFSRARSVVGPLVEIPSGLDRSALERHRQHVESLLNRVTIEAEQWAESATPRAGQQRLVRKRAAGRRRATPGCRISPPRGQ